MVGTVTFRVEVSVDADEADRAEGDAEAVRRLLEDALDRMGTFGDLDWVMDTYDVGEAEVVWEAERWHGTGTTRG